MDKKQETIADILAEMSDFSDKRIEEGRGHAMTSESVGLIVHQLAKRFEAAWKREPVGIPDTLGSAAAMRDALLEIRDVLRSDTIVVLNPPAVEIIIKIFLALEAALSAPARNCDRYKDAPSAYADFIVPWKLDGHLDDVPTLQDFANWLLAPAAERKGEGDGR